MKLVIINCNGNGKSLRIFIIRKFKYQKIGTSVDSWIILTLALLEAQFFKNSRAETGDGYKLYAGLVEGNSYTRKLVHNVVDVVTGVNIFSMIGDGCLFDLKARKLIKATEAQVAALQKNIVKGLTV